MKTLCSPLIVSVSAMLRAGGQPWTSLVVTGAGSALLLGCVSVPDLGPRPAARPPEAYATERSFRAPVTPWPTDRWWAAMGDPQLDALIDEAIASSPTLDQAGARIRRAEAQSLSARAALLPSLSVNGSVARNRSSENLGTPGGGQWGTVGSATLDAAYEIDLWGRNRAALRAVLSDQQAVQAGAAVTRLSLTASVASAYVDLAGLYAQRDVAASAVRIRNDSLALVTVRLQNGLETRAELRQAESGVRTAQAALAALDEAIILTQNRIATLLGLGPDRGLDISRPGIMEVGPAGVPDRIAADLVGRRPDIVVARWRAEAAAERIGVARTRFYPNINLVASLGVRALGLGNLGDAGSLVAGATPALSLPLFDGGRLRANYTGAWADYEEAVAVYDDTLVRAFQDVADTLAAQRSLSTRLSESRAALDASEEAYSVALARYEGGLANFQSVLLTEDAVLAARRAVTDLNTRGLILNVALARALGGGFAASTSNEEQQ